MNFITRWLHLERSVVYIYMWSKLVLIDDPSKAKKELDNIIWNLCRSSVQKANQIAIHAQWEESVDTLQVHLQGLHIIGSNIFCISFLQVNIYFASILQYYLRMNHFRAFATV